MLVKTVLVLMAYAACSSMGLALIKMSMNRWDAAGMSALSLLAGEWRFWVGALLYGLGFVVWLVLLKLNNLSIIFPCAAGSLVVATTLLGHYYLDEAITVKIVMGMALIVCGIHLVTSK